MNLRRHYYVLLKYVEKLCTALNCKADDGVWLIPDISDKTGVFFMKKDTIKANKNAVSNRKEIS